MEAADVLSALSTLRVPPGAPEMELHARVAERLADAGIAFVHEARLAPLCRIDFLSGAGVGIEIKRGKPNRRGLLRQIERYAACAQVSAIIVVVERSVRLPPRVGGKPCYFLSMNHLWGIALP